MDQQQTIASVILDLGNMPAADQVPPELEEPSLRAWWLDSEVADVRLRSGANQVHMEVRRKGIEYHFHGADGQGTTASPWPPDVTVRLLAWLETTAIEYWQRAHILESQSTEAASEYVSGSPLYVHDDNLHRMLELEFLNVPAPAVAPPASWIGAGHASTQHLGGQNHDLVLRWNPKHATPDQIIAVAHTDPDTEEIVVSVLPDVDLAEVGVAKPLLLTWFKQEYRNHLVLHEVQHLIVNAAVERMAGLTKQE